MNVAGQSVLVLGMGRSGLSAARWLAKEGARVTVSEAKAEEALDKALVKDMQSRGIAVETGGHREESFLSADLIVPSPGVPLDMAPLKAAKQKGIPVLGEMALALQQVEAPIVAVTGTNGKSTVTAFLGAMLEAGGMGVFVGGNIGTPLSDFVAERRQADVVVLEVSSFQLDTMETFQPNIGLLLNISPDHLDRYPSYDAYVQSKLRIFKDQGPGHTAILNDDDAVLSHFRPSGKTLVLRYGEKKRRNRQAFVEGEKIIAALPGGAAHAFRMDRCALPGKHNRENLMAAVLAGLALKIEAPVIQETVDRFQGLPHRLERVAHIQGVDFYDDSKATNVEAAARSVSSFDRPVVLIAGGRHKGSDYAPLVQAAKGRVSRAVFLGESKHLLAKAFEKVVPFSLADSMAEAVAQAFSAARPQDVVLLAPACSSFDMFSDYAERGHAFREAVKGLDDEA
jgi:UDP-N-acetylmuramoylalanine--D-glutamate ligase